MGYYAGYSGEIELRPFTESRRNEIISSISEYFEIYDAYLSDESIWVSGSGKYPGDDEVDELLRWLSDTHCIKEGYIEFHGEDESFWKFVYIPQVGKWELYYGEIVYSKNPKEVI